MAKGDLINAKSKPLNQIAVLKGNPCPICNTKNLTLTESETEVPFFGRIFLFSMDCLKCKYHKADIEAAEQKEPVKYTFEVENKKDLDVRVIKSAEATVKVPYIGDIMPGPAASGYITNIEGVLSRLKRQVELLRESEDDATIKKRAKNILKKIQRIFWGQEKVKVIIEDPSGNSAIISEKAVKSKISKTN